MTNNILDLANEFPEFKDTIHQLKLSDARFARLYENYNELCKKIYRSEQRIELMSEDQEESLRVERVNLKDQLYQLLSSANKA